MEKQHRKTKGIKFIAYLYTLTMISLLCGGATFYGPQSTFQTHGPMAEMQLWVFWWTVGLSAALLLVVGGMLMYAIFKFKADPDDKSLGKEFHGGTTLEIGLIVVSSLLLLVIIVPNYVGLSYMDKIPADLGKPLKVKAIGHQWWWEFQIPELGINTANELHVPINRPIDVEVTSADVIHSFWIPKLAGKVDAMPGQKNKMWFLANAPGRYYGQCAELCGNSHAHMRFLAFAHTPENFNKWVESHKKEAAAPKDAMALKGKAVFNTGCNACHTTDGTSMSAMRGPNLANFGSRETLGAGMYENNDHRLAAWIRDPQAAKESSLMTLGEFNIDLNEQEITALVAYLNSLKSDFLESKEYKDLEKTFEKAEGTHLK